MPKSDPRNFYDLGWTPPKPQEIYLRFHLRLGENQPTEQVLKRKWEERIKLFSDHKVLAKAC